MINERLILLADAVPNEMNALAAELHNLGYNTLAVVSLEEFDNVLDMDTSPVLGIIDISAYKEEIWQRCRRLREKGKPVILISPRRSPAVRRKSIELSVECLLIKPLSVKEIAGYVRAALED